MKLWTTEQETDQMNTNSASKEATPRILNIFDLIIIGFGGGVAVGASVLIGEVIKCVTGPAVVVSIFLAGVTALVGGLCFAEFGVQFHKVDSAYPYSYCWGRNINAFIFGWALILQHVAGTASVARGIINFIDALTDHKISELLRNTSSNSFPNVFPYFDCFSFVIVLLLIIFIAFGLKDSVFIKKLFTLCSIILLITIIIAGAFKADIKNWHNEESLDGNLERQNGFAPYGGLGVVKGAALAFYGYIGFDSFSFSGNEIKNQRKTLPLAIFGTFFCILVVFSGIGVILTLMLPYTELSSFAGVPFAFQNVSWTALKWVAIITPIFGFQTSLFGVVFPLPRIIQAMANDGLLFYFLGNINQTLKTPILAIMTGGLLAAVGAGIFTFQTLVNLTVIGALFEYTILAINVILLRYFSKFEENEKGFWKSLICYNSNVSVKGILQNFFNFKENQASDLTKTIIMGNLVLFCFCSIGFSIIFNFFYEFLIKCAAEAVVPASILLCIMIFNIISMCCQPKSQEFMPFKVPLFPFIPCFSIFLNIFLMMTFDSLTWILFSSWMVLGIIPYFMWYLFKCFKGELGKTSVYEINRTNAVKLNESIWKIKSDKKSFYEGAINPVFVYDFDDNPNEEKNDGNVEVKNLNEIIPLQLKQDEIIQKAESDLEQKLQHLESKLQLNFVPESYVNNIEDESEKVQWECVAEIHTEEEFSPESVALEIVDNTYNFLSEVSEEISKDDESEELDNLKKESEDDTEKNSSPSESLELLQTHNGSESSIKKPEVLNEKLSNKSEINVNSKNNEKIESKNKDLDVKENREIVKEENQLQSSLKTSSGGSEFPFRDKNQEDEKLMYLIVESFYEAHQGEMILKQNNSATEENKDGKTVKSILDEQNKVKNFKEKLNQLLKNQINNSINLTQNSSLPKSIETNNSEANNEINKDVIHNSIKTLNKSQIKGKLELLLSKKPPTRPSLRNSFNISMNETNNEIKIEKSNEDIQKSSILNGSDKEESYVKPSLSLSDSIKEKILSLKNVETGSNDICC